jgi:hypothetical protein
MPNARPVLAVLARAGDPWPGQRDNGTSTACSGIRMRPPRGQKSVGQGICQTERALSFRGIVKLLRRRRSADEQVPLPGPTSL